MNEPAAADAAPSLLDRIADWIGASPETREQLLKVLHKTHQRGLIDAESLSMFQGVLNMGELTARDVMVQRSRIDAVDVGLSVDELIAQVIEAGHSRFPVHEGERDRVVGILHTKDLLRLDRTGGVNAVKALLRPPVYVPESKRLNVLLREFRANRNHIALVVDEYGSISGLVTIEDVLEEIVGEIEDEFDLRDETQRVVVDDSIPDRTRFRVHALTSIDEINRVMGSQFPDQSFDTIGGLVTDQFGRIPRRGEHVTLDGVRFEVLRAGTRTLHLLLAERLAEEPGAEPGHGSD